MSLSVEGGLELAYICIWKFNTIVSLKDTSVLDICLVYKTKRIKVHEDVKFLKR